MFDFLAHEFMRNALIAGLLASVVCGIVGTLVVVRRIVFIGGGISHASFGGVGLGYYLSFDPLLGALIFSLGSALGIGVLSKQAREREDTVIGMVWATGMAIGILLMGLTPGYAPDLMSYLLGSIIIVPTSDLWMILFLDLFILGTVVLLYKELLAISFDEEHAKISGLPVSLLYLLLLCMIALTVVVLIRVVGVILAIALLTMPAAISGRFTTDLKTMMTLSVILSALFIVLGLWMSFELPDLRPGATIIIVSAVAYAVSIGIVRLNNRRRDRRPLGSAGE
ncbi:MAG TPA: metal ABC transporter permease [Euryarchaeota archaeon]|nr:metal ABC transporter permease [Euryarchaeota archaeon]